MTALHFGVECVGHKFPIPICNRVPSFVPMTNIWESVTCKWCLKKREAHERERAAERHREVRND